MNQRRARNQPNPNHEGLEFLGDIQRTKFDLFFDRRHRSQKFADKRGLTALFLRNEVKTLFKNIGWGKVLSYNYNSYKKLSCEFLSHCAYDHGELQFRLLNQTHLITRDDICEYYSAPIGDTFGPNNMHIQGFNAWGFWTEISSENRYVTGACKASRIMHPALRVAHRILASIVFPREERSTVSTNELTLLYCMTRRLPVKPNLGAFICDKLYRVSQGSSGQIHCGGLITMLADLVDVEIPDDYERISSDVTLTVDILENMHMFRIQDDGFKWNINQENDITLTINRVTSFMLELSVPTEQTDWSLSEYLDGGEEEHPQHQEPMQQDPTYHDQGHIGTSAAGGQTGHHTASQGMGFTDYPPYHQEYLNRFDALDARFVAHEQNFQSLSTRFDDFTAQYARDEERRRRVEEDRRRAEEERRKRDEEMYTMMQGFQRWNMNQPGYQPPPYQ